MISGGFSAAYKELSPQFERATGHTIVTVRGPSMGNTGEAIPARLSRGEPADVLIMVGYALDDLIAKGKADAASRTELVRSPIGIAIRRGAPKPDISSVEALKQTLLSAKSIAYSDSASGVYVENELFKKLGLEAELRGKSRMIPAEPVAAVVARSEAEIGFQQISELLPEPGAEVVGPLPADVQKITIFSASLAANVRQPDAGRALIAFLASPAAYDAIRRSGLVPVAAKD